MVYTILVVVETDDKSVEAPTQQQVVDEIDSNLESTGWRAHGDILRCEVTAVGDALGESNG